MSERNPFNQEPDHIASRPVYTVSAVYVGMVIAGIAAAWLLTTPKSVHVGLRPEMQVAPKQISSVNQMYGPEKPPLGDVQVAHRARLDEYAWVDAAGNVQIPIERAMEILAAQGIGAAAVGTGPAAPPRED